MAKTNIVFVGGNASYIHCAFASMCLKASLKELEDSATIIETEVRETTPLQFFERLMALSPSVILLSTYLWNRDFFVAVCKLCREVIPDVPIIAGGPQLVPFDTTEPLKEFVDIIIYGEGEEVIYDAVKLALSGEKNIPSKPHEIFANPVDLSKVKLPYYLYEDKDIANRVVYVEATRGCPFSCEYCTSAGSGGIRYFPFDELKKEFLTLINRGVIHFKFLDRSFNHGGEHSLALLDFFRENYREGMTLHFEFTPEEPSEEWKQRLCAFPPKTLHLEVGIQTWEPDIAARIKRPLNREKTTKTLKFLIEEAKADVHADLIIGLPGEGISTIASGFNFLIGLNPAELQVGILKLLPGTAMHRHIEEFELKFSPDPPFEVLSTRDICFNELRRMERFAKCFDVMYNRGRFNLSSRLYIFSENTPFEQIMRVADHLYSKYGRLHALSPKSIAAAMQELIMPSRLQELRVALETDARESKHQQ
jgi:radical SAM superfamily enzyme YgiQ (UPF0313 family)